MCHLKRSASALQLEEELQDDLKWCMLTEKILHVEKSKFQDVELVVTGPFGKVRRLKWRGEAQGYTSKHWPAQCRRNAKKCFLFPRCCFWMARCRARKRMRLCIMSAWCTRPCCTMTTPGVSSSWEVRRDGFLCGSLSDLSVCKESADRC